MSGLSVLATAALIGGGFAAGVLSMLAALPRWRAPSLALRIGPYVRDVVPDERLPRAVLPAVGVLPAGGRALWEALRRRFERLLGGGETLRLRLTQAGLQRDPASFRGRQLGWALGGIAAGAVVVTALAVTGRLSYRRPSCRCSAVRELLPHTMRSSPHEPRPDERGSPTSFRPRWNSWRCASPRGRVSSTRCAG